MIGLLVDISDHQSMDNEKRGWMLPEHVQLLDTALIHTSLPGLATKTGLYMF
jgi:hypothetical protein